MIHPFLMMQGVSGRIDSYELTGPLLLGRCVAVHEHVLPVIDIHRQGGPPSRSVLHPTGRISLSSADRRGMCPGFSVEPRQQERGRQHFSGSLVRHFLGVGEIGLHFLYPNFNEADEHVLLNRPWVHHKRLLFRPLLVLITIFTCLRTPG